MKKSKITMIIMFGSVVLFIALFVIFFLMGTGFMAEYKAAADDAAKGAANGAYTACAFLSYLCSILALASVGVGLFVSDKFKEAEEKAAEQGQ